MDSQTKQVSEYASRMDDYDKKFEENSRKFGTLLAVSVFSSRAPGCYCYSASLVTRRLIGSESSDKVSHWLSIRILITAQDVIVTLAVSGSN